MKSRIQNLFLALVCTGLPAMPTAAQTFTNFYSFTATSGLSPSTNGDGAIPYAGLVLSGYTLYGTAFGGGSSGYGTVFAVHTDGTSFTNLHSFTGGSDGANPYAGLILSSNILYGTAYHGGSSGYGTVFAINTDGTSFTNLHIFTARSGPNLTNSDGANPRAGLILSGGTLYGVANWGGNSRIRVMAQCSPSTRTARILRIYIALLAAVTELIRMAD